MITKDGLIDGMAPEFLKHHLEQHLLNHIRFFFKKVEDAKFEISGHHRLIADALMQVIAGTIKRLIINIPPGYSKTEIAVIGFMSYCFSLFPACRFLHLSYSDDLAMLNSFKVRELIKSDYYQALWPIKVRSDSKAKSRWNVEQYGGGVYATSTNGQVTGFRAGRPKDGFTGAMIIDDPLKMSKVHSDVERNKVNQNYNLTVRSRTHDRNTPIIVIGQRGHEDDLCGFLLNGGSEEYWYHLNLPVLI